MRFSLLPREFYYVILQLLGQESALRLAFGFFFLKHLGNSYGA